MSHVALGSPVWRNRIQDTYWSPTDKGFGCTDWVASGHSGPPRWMYSISSAVSCLLRYLAVSSWIEARVSGVPGIGVESTWGLDIGGGAGAAGELWALCDGRLTANVFSASWTLGLDRSFLLGNLIRGAWGRTAWITRAAGAAILELTLLPMTTSGSLPVSKAPRSYSLGIMTSGRQYCPNGCPSRSNPQGMLQPYHYRL